MACGTGRVHGDDGRTAQPKAARAAKGDGSHSRGAAEAERSKGNRKCCKQTCMAVVSKQTAAVPDAAGVVTAAAPPAGVLVTTCPQPASHPVPSPGHLGHPQHRLPLLPQQRHSWRLAPPPLPGSRWRQRLLRLLLPLRLRVCGGCRPRMLQTHHRCSRCPARRGGKQGCCQCACANIKCHGPVGTLLLGKRLIHVTDRQSFALPCCYQVDPFVMRPTPPTCRRAGWIGGCHRTAGTQLLLLLQLQCQQLGLAQVHMQPPQHHLQQHKSM